MYKFPSWVMLLQLVQPKEVARFSCVEKRNRNLDCFTPHLKINKYELIIRVF